MASKPTISVIDDDESMRLAVAGLVRLLGFHAETYASAEDFLQSGASGRTSCIITDIHMPGLSGIELKRKLDAHHNSAPVIMITGRSETHLHEEALQCGAVCLLNKPFDEETLLSCLKRARIA
jgi:FixJ family two-component response regulator